MNSRTMQKVERLINEKGFLISIILAVSIGFTAINFNNGYSGDVDGHFLVKQALQYPDEGLLPSRSWGFPAYEILIYPVISFTNLTVAKGISLVFYLLSGIVLFLLLERVGVGKLKAFLGSLSFTVLPVSVISGNTLLETSQGLFCSILSIYFLFIYFEKQEIKKLFILALFAGLATSTRPDYILLSVSLGLAVLWFTKPPLKGIIFAVIIWFVFAFVPYLLYPSITFSSGVLLPDPILMRISRAGLGVIILLGFPAWILILIIIFQKRKEWIVLTREDENFQYTMVLTLISVILFGIRFILLPDEIEYIAVLAVLVILFFVQLPMRSWILSLLVFFMALPNVIQVHLFESSAGGQVEFHLGLTDGAIIQDRNARLRLDYQDQKLATAIEAFARQLGYPAYSMLPSIEKNALVILPEDQARFYKPNRFDGKYYRAACSQVIFYYPMPSHRGWRQSIMFENWYPITSAQFKLATFPHCEQEELR